MQPVAWVVQHLGNTPAVKRLQAAAEGFAHLVRRHPLLARCQLVMLVNVVVLQPFKRSHRVVQASGCHAPGTNRRTDQVHCLVRARQPFPEQKTVHRAQNQPLGATGGTGNGGDMLGLQAVGRQRRAGHRARINSKCFHDPVRYGLPSQKGLAAAPCRCSGPVPHLPRRGRSRPGLCRSSGLPCRVRATPPGG